jgi:hypothetical protein
VIRSGGKPFWHKSPTLDDLKPLTGEATSTVFRHEERILDGEHHVLFQRLAVRFADADDGRRMVEAVVNQEPEQYSETRDTRNAEMISYLVDVLLLRRPVEYPSDASSSEDRALEQWGQIGRAMLGDHPDDG